MARTCVPALCATAPEPKNKTAPFLGGAAPLGLKVCFSLEAELQINRCREIQTIARIVIVFSDLGDSNIIVAAGGIVITELGNVIARIEFRLVANAAPRDRPTRMHTIVVNWEFERESRQIRSLIALAENGQRIFNPPMFQHISVVDWQS